MSNWASISVRSETKATLEALQQDGESIDAVIQRLAAAHEGTAPDGTVPDDVLREAHIEDIVSRTARRSADEIEGRLR